MVEGYCFSVELITPTFFVGPQMTPGKVLKNVFNVFFDFHIILKIHKKNCKSAKKISLFCRSENAKQQSKIEIRWTQSALIVQ